ncbi:MAG TPA: OmpA family protein [Bryobacteraceae bacterium]|nr:OmpA family protein [Bryobacteraceae bacterium]
MKKTLPALVALAMFGQFLYAQGMDTRAKPTDWEEVNFEFNQAVIVDGFPAMLRLADLLKQHPDYKVMIVGNADQVGSNRYNDQLSLRRANAVAQFLQHYGAGANQVQTRGDGKRNLEVNSRNSNARYMNRRVVITVTAPDGTVIGDGTLSAAVNDFEKYARGQLGKIDNILSQLQDLEAQVKSLQGDTGAIRQDTASIRQDTGAIHNDTQELVRRPAPLTAEQTTQIARTEATRAADYALTQSALRNRKYGLIGYDLGPTFANGSIHGTGKTGIFSADVFGSALIPFGNGRTPDQPGTHGLQVDGDWVYFRKNAARRDGLTDGIFDIGLVNRFDLVQLGAFAQFDYASFNAYQSGALMGAGVLTMDFILRGGSIGIFGAKGFREYANLGTTPAGSAPYPGLFGLTPGTAAYLRYEDQVGIHAMAGLGDHWDLETSIAFKKRYNPAAQHLPAAFIKLGYSVSNDLRFFVEADENTTFSNLRGDDRVVFGITFGNWLRPTNYKTTQGVVPVSVPRPHYELLQR